MAQSYGAFRAISIFTLPVSFNEGRSVANTPNKARPGENMGKLEAFNYRLPVAGWVSILHRGSGLVMFFLLPFVIWMFDTSITSEVSYARLTALFHDGAGLLPGWFYKLIALALIWAFLHHLLAGLRHLWMDVTHAVTLPFGRRSAIATLVISLLVTVTLGMKLFLA